jgi:imidazolonepropionase-like amidohydrolase
MVVSPNTARPAARTAFIGGTLIDGTGAVPLPDAAVVVANGRFEWVGSTQDLDRAQELRLVDVTGKFLIPGMMDANVHLVVHCDPDVLLRYEPGRYDELVVEAAQVALRAGITTVFDTWGPLEALRRVRDRINAGETTGSRIFLAGNIIGNGGPWSADFFPYGERLNPVVTEAVNAHWEQGVGADLTWMPAEDVRRAVRDYIAAGGIDFVKYASSAHAHLRFIALSPDAQRAIVEEAHAAGMTAQACALTTEALKLAIGAGVDLLQHGNSTGRHPMPQETVDLIAARQLPCVIMLYSERFLAAARADPGFPPNWAAPFETKSDNARRLIKAGAKILHATDGGVFGPTASDSPWVGALLRPPDSPARLGTSHIAWHQVMIEHGMTPMDALLTATRNIAQAYGKDHDLGTVEPGKRADLVVLDANPLDDPRHYERVVHVVKDGAVVDHRRLPLHPVLTQAGPTTGGAR